MEHLQYSATKWNSKISLLCNKSDEFIRMSYSISHEYERKFRYFEYEFYIYEGKKYQEKDHRAEHHSPPTPHPLLQPFIPLFIFMNGIILLNLSLPKQPLTKV
jgi:hypothetical protein